MATNWEDETAGTSVTGPEQAAGIEALACVTCRARKLKCDRRTPVCSRCEKANNTCVYPETRRKPAFKRRNVKELEQRLAQVEGVLKNATLKAAKRHGSNASQQSSDSPLATSDEHVFPQPQDSVRNPQCNELMGLGRFEALPPDHMIEELHDTFFDNGHPVLPMRAMIHKQRYMQAYYSAPHKRPPMCLQYAIWTLAASRLEKYARYHDIFYRRARHYLEVDEMKGSGENFITISHAQAWALLSIYEGGCMHFSRIAMSSAKCVRLVHVLGLHRLDDALGPDHQAALAPTIPQPRTWLELEERRRVFWCAFCVDGHTSITTGWPSLMDLDQITTHLPSSEESFDTGKPEKSSSLQDVFKGAQYSSLAAVIVNCHIFKILLSHIHRFMPDDRPQDVESGPFWRRHRDLDNMLSSTFMFLPERFRVLSNLLDPIAVRTTLNLHGSTICLHNSAWSVAEKYHLPDSLKQSSKTRSLAAAHEIARIIKLVRQAGGLDKRSLTTPALYCAAATFIHQGMENPENCVVANLEFIVDCIEIISRQDLIARAYLNQLALDIQQSGLSVFVKVPATSYHPQDDNRTPVKPLLARGTLFRHNGYNKPKPLPPRLPFSTRTGNTLESVASWDTDDGEDALYCGDHRPNRDTAAKSSKRKRLDPAVPMNFILAENWFGQCAPLHFDPMNLPSVTDIPICHGNLPHRSTAGGLSPNTVPSGEGQTSQEDFLMAFTSLDGSTSVSPVQQSPTNTFGQPSGGMFAPAAGIHGYTSFATGGGSGQLGMGVGPDVFPGLDVWGQMQDQPVVNQEQQLYEAAQLWGEIQMPTGGDGNRSQGGGNNWDSCG